MIQTPAQSGHQEFIQAIQGSTKNIFMTMYRISDTSIASALIDAAERGVEVRIILDRKSLDRGGGRLLYRRMRAHGVDARPSSSAFSITHAKAMIVDGKEAFISSINLTQSVTTSRDFGIITSDPAVITEMQQVFAADWHNSYSNSSETPPLSDANLIWSPVDSRRKLVDLIDSAQNNIVAMTENISDPAIMGALKAAAQRHVNVRLLVPFCDKNSNHFFNVPFVRTLREADVDSRVMPYPATPSRPYIHAKVIVVDGAKAYIGSINFSSNSTLLARELGIVVIDQSVIGKLQTTFASDWTQSIEPPDELPPNCTP